MKAYIGIKYHEDYRNKIIVDKISSILENNGYETICIVRDINTEYQNTYNPRELMKLTFEKIDICDLIIIDLTEKGVGLGIEAGYAYAKGIPIITIAKNGSDISETLEGISNNILFYNIIEDLEIMFRKIIDILSYLKNPCDYSALPYWKETTFTKSDNVKVYHESEWNKLSENTKEEFIKVDKFFRIKHTLEQINNQDLPKDCRYRTFEPNKEEDFDKALEIIKISYPNTDLTKDTLKEYTKNNVYKNELWVFIDKINNGMYMPVAFGIADFDSLVKEGILEWIQVLPEHRGKGFGKFLVAELLRRMKGIAKFATVSGDCNNISNPIGLYRKSGFVGDSNWYIAYKN